MSDSRSFGNNTSTLSAKIDRLKAVIKHWRFDLDDRLEYAEYCLFCDDEASLHYDVPPSRWWRLKVWCWGFFLKK